MRCARDETVAPRRMNLSFNRRMAADVAARDVGVMMEEG